MKRIALVASQKGEFGGLLKRVGAGHSLEGPLRYSRRVRSGEVEWLLYADGQGARAAERACSAIQDAEDLWAMGSIGYCGAARPEWRLGDVMLASQVRDRRNEQVYPCWAPPLAAGSIRMGSILTVERVVRLAADKRRIGQSGVDAVEMEAAAVARVAKERGVPFFSLKAVSDTCEEDLVIDFERATREDGSVRVGSILAQALSRPLYRVPRLGRLANAARLASENLGAALAALFLAKGENGSGDDGDS
ncbi:MAG: hypothetical protein U5J83_08905 [Bryobacterales bacterium]|nr:hypothetical protein [Bryobacterales bacterium]